MIPQVAQQRVVCGDARWRAQRIGFGASAVAVGSGGVKRSKTLAAFVIRKALVLGDQAGAHDNDVLIVARHRITKLLQRLLKDARC
jgi:hypothetical protein